MKHILIVEDDTILNETLSFNLQQKGYITQSAQNQKEALIKLKSVLFDAVLLDVSLPDGNGFSICRNIRQTINLNTAIIFLTADDIEQDILTSNVIEYIFISLFYHIFYTIIRFQLILLRNFYIL